MDLPYY